MNRFAVTAALALSLAGPALAQDAPFQMPRADDPPSGAARPYELPGDGTGLLDGFFNDLITRAQPHLEGLARDMGGLMEDYGPALQELSRLIDDIGNYRMPPERLPNGDIIIRRKADAPPPPPLDEPLDNRPGLAPRPEPEPARPPAAPGQDQITL